VALAEKGPEVEAVKINAKNTETGRPETVILPDDCLPAIAGFNQAIGCGLVLTITQTPGKLSHFALKDDRDGDYDFVMFNDDDTIRPRYLDALCRRFNIEGFRTWKARQSL
jgi:hypothetical protein